MFSNCVLVPAVLQVERGWYIFRLSITILLAEPVLLKLVHTRILWTTQGYGNDDAITHG